MNRDIVDINDKSIPEPYQSLAKRRRTGRSHVLADPDCFKWGETPEGAWFWNEVFRGRSPLISF